ncbi:hypothetical protein [Pedobacter sp. UBA5917]|uniref:hypothetical protein n=1 Tax=Pedobacter sp. UBA5917 TaxID=1947061 RepID=UPI0025D0020A|nr:hypothetical protein [Pedobacter sp. UBA5917]
MESNCSIPYGAFFPLYLLPALRRDPFDRLPAAGRGLGGSFSATMQVFRATAQST